MELRVDLKAVTVMLAEPGELGRFALRVVAPVAASVDSDEDRHRLGDVLEAANVGRLSGDHAYIRPDAVRFHAAGQVAASWEADFAAMIALAGTKGWLDPADGWVRAHVAWPT